MSQMKRQQRASPIKQSSQMVKSLKLLKQDNRHKRAHGDPPPHMVSLLLCVFRICRHIVLKGEILHFCHFKSSTDWN